MKEDEVGRACSKHEGAAKCQESFGVKTGKKNILEKPCLRFKEVTTMDHEKIGGYILESPVPEKRPEAGLL